MTLMPLLLLVGVSNTSAASDTESRAVLTVEVSNGTTNGSAVKDDAVLVAIYEEDKQAQTLEGKANAEGQAVFENVPTGEGIVALPRAKHQNMAFSGRVIELKSGQTVFNATVQVFDVSTDKSKLSVGTHHFIVKAKADSLHITEYMQLKNSSDMAITSEDQDSSNSSTVVEVFLPEGFKDLDCASYFRKEALVIMEDGFYDTMAIPPGTYDAVFSYTLDVTAAIMDVTKKISLPTSEFVLFSQLGEGRVRGLGDVIGHVALADGSSAEYFRSSTPKVGDEIAFQLVGFGVNKSNDSTLVILCVVFAAIAVLVIRRLRGPTT